LAVKYLADKSALARLRHPTVAARLVPLLVGGDVYTCGVVDLELLYSARTPADLDGMREERTAMPRAEMSEIDFERAAEVMALLAEAGRHRAAGIPDLLIAAVAERHRLCLLHYDRDFELIAEVTGQRAEWVVRAGSVP
jgi:predicted nucleic acid-binding protein